MCGLLSATHLWTIQIKLKISLRLQAFFSRIFFAFLAERIRKKNTLFTKICTEMWANIVEFNNILMHLFSARKKCAREIEFFHSNRSALACNLNIFVCNKFKNINSLVLEFIFLFFCYLYILRDREVALKCNGSSQCWMRLSRLTLVLMLLVGGRRGMRRKLSDAINVTLKCSTSHQLHHKTVD